MRIAVAGGGIAGLTSAVALAAKGFSVDVYERAASLQEIGAGIQLSPNAMAVLERLGVAPLLSGQASEPRALVIRDGRSGAVLARVPLGQTMRERYGSPYCTMHRADLQAGLLAAARMRPSIGIHLGAEVTSVEQSENKVSFVAGGERRSADIFIAADGMRSVIRTGFFGYPGPRSLARSAWRATPPAASMADIVSGDEVGLWLGPGGHVVHYPISGGRQLNVVAITAGGTATPPPDSFLGSFQEIIERIDDWQRSPLSAVDASLPWTRGRVALVGDAAHGMAPSAAQGGAQAIEDAWALASALHRVSGEEAALREFAQIRLPRVRRVAKVSENNLKLYEFKGVPAIFRNIFLSALPAKLFVSRLDWLFQSSNQ